MTQMTPELRQHIANKKMSEEIASLSNNLVNSTNIMSGEKYIAQALRKKLQDNPQSYIFFALLGNATPHILKRLSASDGRITATHSLLTKVNSNLDIPNIDSTLSTAFADGILNSHSTLIQSFYGVIQLISSAKYEPLISDELESNVSTNEHYKSAVAAAEEALDGILALGEDVNIPHSDDYENILATVHQNPEYLPFI
jgi:hypothetical protein